ncbi:hypothetical protein TruAng_009274 [Truncatella angustata]|nr:hypothetical protein TruAng_009274 [Truncatella angustata]
MVRPQQISKLVAPPVPNYQRLLPIGGPRSCSSSFNLARVPRFIVRAFTTTPLRRDPQQLNPQTLAASSTIPETQPLQEPKPDRWRRGYVYAAIFLLVGTSIGSLFRLSVSPPPLPEPGTKEDEYIISDIHATAESLPIVQALSSDPSWESWHAYEDRSQGQRNPSITSGPLQGCRGLAYQRIFYNKNTGEMTNVVYFGAALSGFPGVAHGGILSTILDESLGRCAIARFPAKTGVTASLEVAFKRPTLTNAFYVVKTEPVIAEEDEVVGKDGTKKSDRKLRVRGSIETLEGKVLVEAKALFVVPKTAKLNSIGERW